MIKVYVNDEGPYQVKIPCCKPIEVEVESELVGIADPYPGPYTVTPTVAGFVLQTQYKAMTENLTINPIPYTTVENAVGGLTAYIAPLS